VPVLLQTPMTKQHHTPKGSEWLTEVMLSMGRAFLAAEQYNRCCSCRARHAPTCCFYRAALLQALLQRLALQVLHPDTTPAAAAAAAGGGGGARPLH
jgi:hypothetical protein